MAHSENEDNLNIRPLEIEDLDRVREICVETSSLKLADNRDRELLLLMYCDPYVLYAADDSFVATDDADSPVGYVFCAADTRRFMREFRRNIIPRTDRLGFKRAAYARGVYTLQLICPVIAPAHLHINLTASARGKGTGTVLINTLKAHLALHGIKSVQLTCGSENKQAIRFYKRNGFGTVFKGFGACVMRSYIENK